MCPTPFIHPYQKINHNNKNGKNKRGGAEITETAGRRMGMNGIQTADVWFLCRKRWGRCEEMPGARLSHARPRGL